MDNYAFHIKIINYLLIITNQKNNLIVAVMISLRIKLHCMKKRNIIASRVFVDEKLDCAHV